MTLTSVELIYSQLVSAKIATSDMTRVNKCMISSIPEKYKKPTSDRPENSLSRPLILGRFFHDLIESITSASLHGLQKGSIQLTDFYYELIESYEKQYADFLVSDDVPLSEWNTMYPILETANEIMVRQLEEGVVPIREVTLTHSAGYLHGKIDELVVTDKLARITDYKLKTSITSIVTDQAIDQLHFYANLVADRYPTLEIQLALVGLNGSVVDIELDRNRRIEIFNRASDFAKFLREIGKNQTPVEEICPGCELCAPTKEQ